MPKVISVLLVLVMSLVACAGDGSDSAADGQTPGASDACVPNDPDCQDIGDPNDLQGGDAGEPTTPSEVLSVEEVVAAGQIDGGFVVRGHLFIDADGNAVLCSAIAESFPPQCGGESIPVAGEIPGLTGLSTAQGLRWSDTPVELEGTFDGTTFTPR